MNNLEKYFSEGLLLTTSRHETKGSNSVGEYSEPPIPDDLLVDIFSRVPAKSIDRFRCVSKYWASILRGSYFTDLFLTKSLTRPRLLFTIKAKGRMFFYSTPQPHNPDDNSSLSATPYHCTSIPNYRPTFISKPVCGLVLVQGWGRRQGPLICNPAKGKVESLPEVPRKGKNPPKGIYLGYDPIRKQFKVLCLSLNNSGPNSTHWILTLESGKRLWRELETEFNFKEDGEIHGDICINGVLYFEGRLEGSFVIVCFDVRSEKFSFINKDKDMLPEPFSYSCSLTLFNYKDKLGIHRWVRQKILFWVLEDGVNHKWSEHSYVSSDLDKEIVTRCRFLGMTSSGEIVYSGNSCVFFYNLEKNTLTRVNIQKVEYHDDMVRDTFADYVENMKFI